MRNFFDEQLALLNTELIEMGALCEDIIAITPKALGGENDAVKKAKPLDGEIRQKERDIEGLCLKLLLQQQPVARDLRQISAALKMVTDMERIGDQAADIAEILYFLRDGGGSSSSVLIKMAKSAMKMVTESVDAFVKHDIMLAEKVAADDDAVDGYFVAVKRCLIEEIAQNPAQGESALDLLMIAKYFERIGDHAVNIAHWVMFSITGEHRRENDDLVR